MPSVCTLIDSLAGQHASRTALVDLEWDEAARAYRRGAATSYAALHDRVLRAIEGLRAAGVGPGDRLAVLLDNSVDLVVTEWACLLSGMLWVALNVRSSAAENAAILADCTPAALVTSPRHRAAVDRRALGPSCLVLETGPGGTWEEMLEGSEARACEKGPGPEDPVRIRYTSGTAGRPKGAVLPRRCYDASVEVVSDILAPLAAGDVLAQVAPMTHAAGAMWLPHAAVGATALLADRFEAGAFLDLARRERVTAAFLVPTMLVRVVEALATQPAPPSLRTVVYGGAAMPVDRLEAGLERLGPVFVQIYGLTESNWPVTALRREEHAFPGDASMRRRRLASCGRATAVGQLRIVTEDGREARPGEPGEVRVRGRNTMLGYWGGATDTAKGLDAEGWMHTGDVAVRDEDGFVTIVDRLHDMIVSGGFNVYPREVEDALSSHPAVLEAAVVGLPDAEWGERVHAVVVLRQGRKAALPTGMEDSPEEQQAPPVATGKTAVGQEARPVGQKALAAELAAHVAARTAPYKKPRSFDFVAELPKNASGKVLRRVLKTTKPPA